MSDLDDPLHGTLWSIQNDLYLGPVWLVRCFVTPLFPVTRGPKVTGY